MENFLGVNWGDLFRPGTPVIEIIVRGSVMYLGLFLLLRVILKREAGTMGITDLLVVVLLADAAQNAMAGDYKSITDGMVLVVTLVFWAYALNWLSFHSPVFRTIVEPPPLPLVRDGRPLRSNMRRELITHEELMSQLRLQGVEALDEVKEAHMEPDGRVSVIKRNGDKDAHPQEKRGT